MRKLDAAGRRKSISRANLLKIGLATLGILASDTGTKSAHAALPKERPSSFSRIEPLPPGLKELQSRWVFPGAEEVRDRIIAMRQLLKQQGAVLRKALNKRLENFLSEIPGSGTHNVDSDAVKKAAQAELTRMEGSEVCILADRILKNDANLQTFFRKLMFSEQWLGSPQIINGSELLRDMLMNEGNRTEALRALAETEAILKTNRDVLNDAIYYNALRDFLRLQQPPQLVVPPQE